MKTQSAKAKCRRCGEKFVYNYPEQRICDECKTKCSTCGITLTPENQDFSSLNKRKNYMCKACVAEGVRKTRCKTRQKEYDLQRNYGITLEVYNKMARHGCSICGEVEARLVVDHCHTSGSVRGVLCTQCNVALGMFKDDKSRLEAAYEYLS